MVANTVLILIIALLTLNLLLVGVYIFLVLKDVRETVRRTNKILDDVERVTEAVSNPVVDVAGILNAVTSGFKAFRAFRKNMEDGEEDGEE